MQFHLDYSILIPGGLSAAIAACAYLYFDVKRLKRKTDLFQSDVEKDWRFISKQTDAIQARLEDVEVRNRDTENAVASLAAVRRSQAQKIGLDTPQRTQVIRMARRGDSPDQIAAELRVPRNEVEFLLKVQRATIARVA